MKEKIPDPRVVEKVLEMVAAHYKTTPETLKDDEGDLAAKRVVMYVLRECLGVPLRASREAVGKKHDPDVYLAIRKITELLKTDTVLASLIDDVKTEALIIAAAPSTDVETAEPADTQYRTTTPAPKPSMSSASTGTVAITPSGSTEHSIACVRKVVAGVFLDVNLLQSSDPAAEVMLAKDVVVFLVWDIFPRIPLPEMLNVLSLDCDGFHRAIGRVLVCLRENKDELKKKIEAARGAYLSAE